MKSVFDSIDETYFRLDRESAIAYISVAAKKLLGLEPEALVGKPFSTLFASASCETALEDALSASAGVVNELELQVMTQSGQAKWVSLSAVREFDKNGLPSGAQGIMRDIDAGKRREQVLAASEALYRNIFEELQKPIYTINRDGRLSLSESAIRENSFISGILFEFSNIGVAIVSKDYVWLRLSPSLGKMLGFMESELVEKSVYESIHEHDRGRLERCLSCMQVDRSIDRDAYARCALDIRFIKKSGQIMHSSLSVSGYILQGRLQFAMLGILDITDRKTAEKRIMLAANVFKFASEGIAIMDPSKIIVDVNQSFSAITGFSKEEALGHDMSLLSINGNAEDCYEGIEGCLEENDYWKGELWGERKDGRRFAMLQNVSVVRDAAGAVAWYIALFSDITESKERERQLENDAHYDALTKLPNRLFFTDRLQHCITKAATRDKSFVVLYIDLDGFKTINDTYGHDAGDIVLRAVSDRMKQALRVGDTLARLGGDEFSAIICDVSDRLEIERLADRLLQAASAPVDLGEHTANVSASIGISAFSRDDIQDSDAIVRQADCAMYQAKLQGKNRYRFYRDGCNAAAATSGNSLAPFERALLNREFVVHYQPRIDLANGAIVGFEGLLRWEKRSCGLLTPKDFLPSAGRLSAEIDFWAIEEAVREYIEISNGIRTRSLGVNLHMSTVTSDGFIERLREILRKYPKFEPLSLEIEISESAAMRSFGELTQVIEDTKALGIRWAIDDFGTGGSTFVNLQKLTGVSLKIDQSFVCRIFDDEDSLSLVKGAIAFGQAFERTVIAEGVETVEQCRRLVQLGCGFAQGYYMARPMSAEAIGGWLAHWRMPAEWRSFPKTRADT